MGSLFVFYFLSRTKRGIPPQVLLSGQMEGEFLLSLIFLSDEGGILPQDVVLSKDT